MAAGGTCSEPPDERESSLAGRSRDGGQAAALRRMAAPVLLPTVLVWLGQGAVLPTLALSSQQLGASAGGAALVVAALGLGQLLGALPAGVLAARLGERQLLVGASVLIAGCWAAAGLTHDWLVLVAAVLLAGLSLTAFDIGRQILVVDVTPPALHGRMMSTLGAVGRVGLFVGPAIGAAVQSRWGLAGAYSTATVASLVAVIPLLTPSRAALAASPSGMRVPSSPVGRVARSNLRALLAWGSGAAVIAAARSVRPALLPLWAVRAHLSPTVTSLLFAVAGGLELAAAYPGGALMDHRGRAWAVLPCTFLMGIGLLVLPLAASPWLLVVASALLGIGSGLGAGIVKVLAADTAPAADRATYLGLWGTLTEIGGSGGLLLVAALASFSLPVASIFAAVMTLGGAGWLARLFHRQGSAR